jgi:hypothetical protein
MHGATVFERQWQRWTWLELDEGGGPVVGLARLAAYI